MFFERIVKAWNEAVALERVRCDREQCPKCGQIPGGFEICELRSKTFLALAMGLVYSFEALTIRWRCPLCGHRFTQQPPWGLPRKRYVKGVILSRCWRYLRKAESSYRSVMAGMGYKGSDEMQPSHSRVWHWLKDLGQMVEVLRLIKRLILAKNPATAYVGQPISIFPCKYRSQARHELLKDAYSLLQLRPEWFHLFAVSFPPVVGTTAF